MSIQLGCKETYQAFWCCEHHQSAIQNFSDKRWNCEWGCHKEELKWFHHGKNPMPKSWGSKTISGM